MEAKQRRERQLKGLERERIAIMGFAKSCSEFFSTMKREGWGCQALATAVTNAYDGSMARIGTLQKVKRMVQSANRRSA